MSNMTPSETITIGQTAKICELISAKLRKSNIQSDSVQKVIEHQAVQLTTDLMSVICRYVDAVSDIISRHVNVDRSISPEHALSATGRKQFVDNSTVSSMPMGDGDKTEVIFFKLGRWINDGDLDDEYEERGLIQCDPITLAKVNEEDPSFADEYPNGTHWKDKSGRWCFAAFYRWGGDRYVCVDRDSYGWYGGWWFAGLRK